MQLTSQAWKDAQKQTLVPEAFVEISIKIADPEAQEDATVSPNGAESFATPQEIMGENVAPVKYATLEPGLWILDGTYRIVGSDLTPSGGDDSAVVGYAVVGKAIVGKGVT